MSIRKQLIETYGKPKEKRILFSNVTIETFPIVNNNKDIELEIERNIEKEVENGIEKNIDNENEKWD
jgi:hypothetical protein